MTDPNLNEELEGGLRTALRLLADDEGAAPGADIARARVQGRRAVRNRRLTRIVAPLAAAAVTAAAVGLAMPQKAETVAPAQGGQDDAQSNRWTVPVSFGWLPPGFVGALENYGNGSYSMIARSSDAKEASIDMMVLREPAQDLPWEWGPKVDVEIWDADPVHGRTAQWGKLKDTTVGSEKKESEPFTLFLMRFQYAENLWAQIGMRQLGGKTSEEVTGLLRRVVDGLDLTERQLTLPFQITGLPPELWTLSMEITDTRELTRRKVIVSFRHGLRVAITPAGLSGAPKPNTTLDGHPAYHFAGTETRLQAVLDSRGETASPDWESITEQQRKTAERQRKMVGSEVLCVYGVKRSDVCLYTEAQVPVDPTVSIDVVTPGPDWASEILKPSGGLVGLFQRMTLIDGPVSEWSATPLRD
ncbi:hypothetical protein [Actinocorallia aurantiaca]|uniref:Uncharacterized protein n=1 Tax=Actinocorallia aurantiaca TaxID=46204 RepID=A0ABN3U5F7_9ACTN